MIFVNGPGDWGHVFPPFDHAEWHGVTPTDFVFPFFLFVVGTSCALSLVRREAEGATRGELVRHALVRGAVIVFVGWAMAAFPYTWERLRHLRIPGVLPRIGVVYALGTLLVLAAPARRRVAIVAVAAAALLALHTFLLLGTGYDLSPKGNVARAVDRALLEGHLWKVDWDPEGIVSTLTALATMMTGVLAGELLLAVPERRRREAILAASGPLGIAAGAALAPRLPLNKNLWTATYVLVTSGAATLLLAICLAATDRPEKQGRVPFLLRFFVTFGRNPLLAFVLSGMLARVLGFVKVETESGAVTLQRLLYAGGFSWIHDPTLRSHAWAGAMLLFWYLVLRVFERREWYWKI